MEDFSELEELKKAGRFDLFFDGISTPQGKARLKKSIIKSANPYSESVYPSEGQLVITANEVEPMELVLDQNRTAQVDRFKSEKVFGERIGIMGKLFGCWHKELTRPFTNRRLSYRACLNCGAMKKFDTDNMKAFGPFYYPPIISPDVRR